MKLLQDTSISVKVLLAPIILILALASVSLLATWGLNRQRATLSEVDEIVLERLTLIDEFIVLSEQIQSDVFKISVLRFMNLPEQAIAPVRTHLEQNLNDLNALYGQVSTGWPLDERERSILEQMKAPLDDFGEQALQAAQAASDDPALGALPVLSSTVPFAKLRATLAEFRDYQATKIVQAEAESRQRANAVSATLVAFALLVGLAGGVTTVLISTRLISAPIRSTTELMRRLAEGDLSIEVCNLDRRDEIGAMARAVEVFRQNAIEKARLDQALRESEEKYRSLFEYAHDSIFIIDPSTRRLIDANQNAARRLGYTREELLNLTMEDIDTPAAATRNRAILQKLQKNGSVVFEHAHRRKDGSEMPIEISSRIIEISGKQVFQSLARDITRRKQAEKLLKEHSERLEEMVEERTQELREAQEQLVRREKLAVLGQWAGGIAHELRNPLSAIKNAAYFLNLALEKPEPEVAESLQILDREVSTSERIITSLLDFARARPPVRREVNLNNVLNEALSRLTLPDCIEVVNELDPALPTLQADPHQLAQVFDNLIHNAIQAMPDGGRLMLKSEVDEGDDPGHCPEWVAVSVTDTGVGISQENLEKLFEPLFTTKVRGIGLGLALAKSLVERNGGTIAVENEGRQGSTFTVRLPKFAEGEA
ncbi:MAG: ATP-binding protein [Anaerolineae bacterium]